MPPPSRMVRMTQTNTGGPERHPTAITVREAAVGDLAEVLRVQRAAFRRVARRFGFPEAEMAPLTETLDQLEALLAQGMRTFIAVAAAEEGERVVGTVRGAVRADAAVEIGRLAVDDGYERLGVASTLMRALETAHPDAPRFELYTGSEASDALSLYGRLGYRVFRTEAFENWTRVWLGKDAVNATAPADAPLH